MGKIAFVFAGQGAQYSGMGKALYEMGGSAKKLYDSAEIIRKGTIEQSFSGTDEELKKTVNTQPCLYLMDLAAALTLNDNGIFADGVAGFSLGEIASLAYAGAYSYEDGFRMVIKRGQYMDACCKGQESGMAAILKLSKEELENLIKDFQNIYPVNYNCPGQIAVSGLKDSVEAFSKVVSENGGRAIPIAVSGAFHSPFMNEASENFRKALDDFDIKKPEIPVYANMTSKPYTDNVKDTVSNQIKNPVLWQSTVENMISDGFTDFIEVGAGKTLSGLIKKTSKEVNIYSVQDKETLEKTLEAVKNNA